MIFLPEEQGKKTHLAYAQWQQAGPCLEQQSLKQVVLELLSMEHQGQFPLQMQS